MDLLIVAATEFEIAPLLETNPRADILITGIGSPATIYHLTKKLLAIPYRLVIQAGIAGTFKDGLDIEQVVAVEQDTFADLGVDDGSDFSTIFESGLAGGDEFPFSKGWLKNESEFFSKLTLRVVKGITVNKIVSDEKQLNKLREKFEPDVESMEGAACHYVCLQQNVNFLQLRSISNHAGERNKTKWKISDAVSSLNIVLQQITSKYTDPT